MQLLTQKDVQEMCQVSRAMVNQWRRKGLLKAYRLGKKCLRFRREDVERMLQRMQILTRSPVSPKELDPC